MEFKRIVIWILVFLMIVGLAVLGNASPGGPKAALACTKAANAGTKTTTKDTNATTKGTNATTKSTKSSNAKAANIPMRVKKITGKLALDRTITVEVENLKKFLAQPGKDVNKFILYLDWRPIKGLNVTLIDDTEKLQFDIERTDKSKEQWNYLLGSPQGWTRKVSVSIGYENEKAIQTDVEEYTLAVVKKGRFFVFIPFFLFVLILFFYFAKTTNIIRDPSPKPPKGNKPLSLGRTQMAFWFFVIGISYVCIWMITGDLESITESALALMGISAATALSAEVVGASKQAIKEQEDEPKIEKLTKEKEELEKRLKTLLNEIAAATKTVKSELEVEKTEKENKLKQVNAELFPEPPESKGLRDLVSDVNGISLYRFQIVIWTIVLGIIFVNSIYRSLAMPEFSGTLLALMGISSGTYIGFKFPEKKN